jgi:hypothetical protein
MRGAMPPLPNTPLCSGAQLKRRDNLTITFYLYEQEATTLAVRTCEAGEVGVALMPLNIRFSNFAWKRIFEKYVTF